MKLRIVKDASAVGSAGADLVANRIRQFSSTVLGLATGSTMVPFYRELVRLHHQGSLDFTGSTMFMLDEYCGVAANDPRSNQNFLRKHFLDRINVDPGRVYLPDGLAADLELECRRYEEVIEGQGGIDLQILGIGINGHIAFNEPNTPFDSRTHVISLRRQTIAHNQAAGGYSGSIPTMAITMGIKTIMHARQLVLMAFGEEKAQAVAQAIEGPVTPNLPASVLQLHPNATVIVDEAASAYLNHRASTTTASVEN